MSPAAKNKHARCKPLFDQHFMWCLNTLNFEICIIIHKFIHTFHSIPIHTYIPYHTIPFHSIAFQFIHTYHTIPFHSIPLHSITLHTYIPYRTIPFHSIPFHSTTLHYITLHYITLHYITYKPHQHRYKWRKSWVQADFWVQAVLLGMFESGLTSS